MGGRGYRVREDTESYGYPEFDPDSDFDPDELKPIKSGQGTVNHRP